MVEGVVGDFATVEGDVGGVFALKASSSASLWACRSSENSAQGATVSSSSQSVGLFASVEASKAGKGCGTEALPSLTEFNEDGALGGRPDRILGSGTPRGSLEEAARSLACNLALKAAFAAHGS